MDRIASQVEQGRLPGVLDLAPTEVAALLAELRDLDGAKTMMCISILGSKADLGRQSRYKILEDQLLDDVREFASATLGRMVGQRCVPVHGQPSHPLSEEVIVIAQLNSF